MSNSVAFDVGSECNDGDLILVHVYWSGSTRPPSRVTLDQVGVQRYYLQMEQVSNSVAAVIVPATAGARWVGLTWAGAGGGIVGIGAAVRLQDEVLPFARAIEFDSSDFGIPEIPAFVDRGPGVAIASLFTFSDTNPDPPPFGWVLLDADENANAGVRQRIYAATLADGGAVAAAPFSDSLFGHQIILSTFYEVGHLVPASQLFTVEEGVRIAGGPTVAEPRNRPEPRAVEPLPMAPDPSPIVVPTPAHADGRYPTRST